MSAKIFEIESIGKVSVSKRRSSRQITLSLSPQGKVRVSIPLWAPYQSGVNFAKSKAAWIMSKQPAESYFFQNQKLISGHEITFTESVASLKPIHKIYSDKIVITFPATLSIDSSLVQQSAQKAAIKVLRKHAEAILQPRVELLSKQHNLPFQELKIKQLSRRWGSCDKNKVIVLNLYLAQLPSELVDYVICHELTHTKQLNHGPQFWAVLNQISPNAQYLRRKIKQYDPKILMAEG